MKILVIGSQGSGKSTQAELLAKKLGSFYLSTGKLFRKIARQKSAFGQEVKELLEKGHLIPDQPTLDLVHQILRGRDDYVVEGFPRNLSQAKKFKYGFEKVFFLKIQEKKAIRRLTARRVCPNCKANFNLVTQPPKQKDLCDNCGAKLIHRHDDTEIAIRKRLEIFYRHTNKVLDYYRQKGIFQEINAERPIKIILQDIASRL